MGVPPSPGYNCDSYFNGHLDSKRLVTADKFSQVEAIAPSKKQSQSCHLLRRGKLEIKLSVYEILRSAHALKN